MSKERILVVGVPELGYGYVPRSEIEAVVRDVLDEAKPDPRSLEAKRQAIDSVGRALRLGRDPFREAVRELVDATLSARFTVDVTDQAGMFRFHAALAKVRAHLEKE